MTYVKLNPILQEIKAESDELKEIDNEKQTSEEEMEK